MIGPLQPKMNCGGFWSGWGFEVKREAANHSAASPLETSYLLYGETVGSRGGQITDTVRAIGFSLR